MNSGEVKTKYQMRRKPSNDSEPDIMERILQIPSHLELLLTHEIAIIASILQERKLKF